LKITENILGLNQKKPLDFEDSIIYKYIIMCIYIYIPVVPHKAVAEASKIRNF